MKIFLCGSKHFYSQLQPIIEKLEKQGHEITLPNSFEKPFREEEMKILGAKEHQDWKAEKLREQVEKVKANEALLVCNFEKNGVKNYIGGATFLEMFKAFELGKKIYLYNQIPEGIFKDELLGMNITVINGDLEKIK